MTGGGDAVDALAVVAGTTPGAAVLPEIADLGPLTRIVLALAVLVVGVLLSKYVVLALEGPVSGRFRRESFAQIVLRSVRLGVVLIAAFVAAALLGFGPTDLLLSVTVFSAVLGLVLAPIIGNVINGLFVLADQPYDIGDLIELQDRTRGFVDDITLRYTKVFTLDNTFLVIPNSGIRDQQIVNHSAEDERTRVSLPLLVTYGSDLEAARDLFERAARDCEDVIDGGPDIRIGTARYPARPTAYIDEHADDGILVNLRYWAIKPYKLLTVRSDVQTRIRELLAETDAEIEIAYPHRQLVFDDGDTPVPFGGGPDDRSGPRTGRGSDRPGNGDGGTGS